MTNKANINEIFTSIQGEGPYVGVKQLFIRFCGCNLKCNYCDTIKAMENAPGEENLQLSPQELKQQIEKFELSSIHSISITGGEPLLWVEYLEEFLPLVKNKVYLETNATLFKHLNKILKFVDYISADIKLPSVSGIGNSFASHDEFFKSVQNCNCKIFAKIVFDENILDSEIENCIKLAQKYDLELVLQPKMDGNELKISEDQMVQIFDKFLAKHNKTRLIPQVHKFLRVL